jgi:hypothetical protein
LGCSYFNPTIDTLFTLITDAPIELSLGQSNGAPPPRFQHMDRQQIAADKALRAAVGGGGGYRR